MAEYRLYRLDGANRITRAEAVIATSDKDAIDISRGMKLPVKCELWHRDRLVARIPGNES